MNVSLTPQLELYVKQKISGGLYNSASEVIREALRLLEERDSLKNIKKTALINDLKAGITSLDNGQSKKLNIASIKTKGRSLLTRKS